MDKYVDVGDRFDTLFHIGFYAACVIVCAGFLHLCFRSKIIRVPMRCAVALANWTLFIVAVGALFVRFSHTGRVCSGDFLNDNESTEGYTISQGLFYLVIAYIWAGCCGLSICSFIIALFMGTS